MIFRALTGVSAICLVLAILMFAASWRWLPHAEWQLSDNRYIGIESRFGGIMINDITMSDPDQSHNNQKATQHGQSPAQAAQVIDQQVRDGEINIVAVTPPPWYDFLFFAGKDYDNIPRNAGIDSWRWFRIPYWPVILAAGILPAIWLVRHSKRQGKPGS